MTVHTPNTEAKTQQQHSALARLRMRETALRQQAAQLQARAEHLERVGQKQAQQLKRRIDAHEKIVLGSLVKKAGLDWPAPDAVEYDQRHPIDNDAPSFRQGIDAKSTAYDREFILGALIWLVWALKQPANVAVSMPERQRLRDDGMQALNRRG